MSNHTPTPWPAPVKWDDHSATNIVIECSKYECYGGKKSIAKFESEEDAARAVLCVNFLSAHDNLDLCEVVSKGELAGLIVERDRLLEVNREMLAALERIDLLEGSEHNEWDAVERVIPAMCEIARAMITKHAPQPVKKEGQQ